MNAAPNGALMVRFAASAEELTAMESVLAGTLALIDGKIGDLYGFTPSSPPATAEDRVKVAKVMKDLKLPEQKMTDVQQLSRLHQDDLALHQNIL